MRRKVKADEGDAVTVTLSPILVRLLCKAAYDMLFVNGLRPKEYDTLREFHKYLLVTFPLWTTQEGDGEGEWRKR